MLCFEVRSSCQCTDSPPNDRSHTCYKFEIWNLGHIMTYHSSFTLGSNPDELLLDSLNSTSVLHHPFLYNDRDVMKVGSRTGSCLSASCGMCYPLLYRWTQQVELRNEENTCRYHWLVQRESHSEQFHNPCFTNQYPLCTPTPSIPFYVTLFFHYILIWGKIPLMISNDEPAAHKEWFNDKSTHLFVFFWWRISVKRWRCLLSFWVSMQIPKPIKHIGYKKQDFWKLLLQGKWNSAYWHRGYPAWRGKLAGVTVTIGHFESCHLGGDSNLSCWAYPLHSIPPLQHPLDLKLLQMARKIFLSRRIHSKCRSEFVKI